MFGTVRYMNGRQEVGCDTVESKVAVLYDVLNESRLAVNNFTGRTVEAIKQDFFSTLFVSGLETILSAEVNRELASKNTRHRQQVNKAISFHAIKDSIILLMFDPPPDFEDRVKRLFLISPTLRRPERVKEKERLSLKSNARSLHFQKFARKAVF